MIWCQANCCPSMSSASRLTTDCPIAKVGLGLLAGNDGMSAVGSRRTSSSSIRIVCDFLTTNSQRVPGTE